MIHELIFAGALFFHPSAMKDSLGVETVNGKTFVIHKVDEKETLFALSRRYGATVDAILQSNPGLSSTLEVGQIVKVPYTRKATAAAPREAAQREASIHKVAAKETMYSISRTYGVSVEDIKKWNNLTDNSLSVGQELIVRPGSKASSVAPVKSENRNAPEVRTVPSNGMHTVQSGETLFSVARQYGLTVSQVRSWNTLESDELKPGQVIFVSARREAATVAVKPVETGTNNQQQEVQTKTENKTVVKTEPQQSTEKPAVSSIRISESMKNSDEIIEAGVAELIEGTEGNRKYLALHRTAPVGTILKVRNEMNNREVFVRVMGKIPEAAANDKVLIRLSRSAYDRLGAIDPRFRVEVTYYK